MKEEVRQYYESLIDKDNDKTRYFFDITAENTNTGMKFTMISVSQNQQRSRGAENFKNFAERAERCKYDLLHVTEYAADGQTVVNTITFNIAKKRNKQDKPAERKVNQSFGGLAGFERQLNVLGFQDGLSGMIAASAEKISNEEKLRRQEEDIEEYKRRISKLESDIEKYKAEADSQKEKCKDIADQMKDLKRAHKFECQRLKSRNSLGSLAVQGFLAYASKNTKLGSVLGDLIGDGDGDGDDDDDDLDDDDDDSGQTSSASIASISSGLDPESRKYLNGVVQYCQQCDGPTITKIATIFQYISVPGNLDKLVLHCQQDYQQSQK